MDISSRIIAAAGAATLLVATGTAAASATPAYSVTGGKTMIDFSSTASKAWHSAGVKITATSPATLRAGVLTLPTTGGTAAPPNYVTSDAGGITLTRGPLHLSVHRFVLNTRTHSATAIISGHANQVVLTLGDPNGGNGGPGYVQFGGYPVTWSTAAAKELDAGLHTGVFAAHHALGTGSTTVKFA